MSGQQFSTQNMPTLPSSGGYRHPRGGGGGGVPTKLIIGLIVGVVLLGGGAVVIGLVISNIAAVANAAASMARARENAENLRRTALGDFNAQRYHDPRACELQMVMHLAQAATLAHGSGDEGERALQVIASTTGRLHPAAERYYLSAKAFHGAGAMNPDRMRDRPSVVRQLERVATLADANRELRQGWATLPDQIRQDLTGAGVDAALTEAIVREVQDGLRLSARPLFHDTYGRYCDSIVAILNHLDGYWGKWRFNEQFNKIEFEGQNAFENYEMLRKNAESIGRTLLERANDVYAGPV